MKTRAKNHHFVPRSYLQRFADNDGFLHVYDSRADSIRRQRPKEVMKINSYYRQEWVPEGIDPNIFETMLGEGLETESKIAIDKLHSAPEDLDEKDIANLVSYFELQRIRVPRQAEMGKALIRDVVLRLAPPGVVKEIASGRFQLKINDSARFDLIRYSIGRFSPWFESMEWEVVAAEDGASFITTDSPLSLYNPAIPPPAEAGIALAGTMVFFPLSSRMALLMSHPVYSVQKMNPTQVLPIPKHEDADIAIVTGGTWPVDVVDRFNWKLAQLNSTLVVADSPLTLHRCFDAGKA